MLDIKNVEELANVLAMAFRTFSAEVARGIWLDAFMPLIEGERTVTVIFKLDETGRVTVAEQTVKVQPEIAVVPTIVEASEPAMVYAPVYTEIVEEKEEDEQSVEDSDFGSS